MSSIVALDLETTGLDPYSDAIIEIGAVRFNENRVEAEFSQLINPSRLIPREITQLTGITNEMVRNMPQIGEVIGDLAAFVGDLPVLGHNIRFDLGFLQNHHILYDNEAIDTYELASILLPTSSRYNLEALGQSQGVWLQDSHRALADARTTHALFLQFYEKCFTLPIELVAELVKLSDPFPWDGSWVFRQVLRQRSSEYVAPQHQDEKIGTILTPVGDVFQTPLTPVENPVMLDADEIAALLEYGGLFSKYFASYEYRPQQVEMLRAVAQAFSNDQHLMVEAGTGTGKSFAYLAPAALWAIQNQMRVVISTNTINLQDQLIKKDIPDLMAALDLDLRAVVLKGRSNYLCPRRLENFRSRGPENADELRVLGKILVWLLEGGSGDRGEINLNGPVEREVWSTLSAEDEGCKAEVCVSRMGGVCPFYRAHLSAQSAHLVIVNHALLLADVATGSRVLPEYQYLIIDEGHHMEAATTNALSYRVTQAHIARLLRELGGSTSGIMGHLLSLLREILRPADVAAFDKAVRRLTDLSFRLDHDFKEFFRSVDEFLFEMREGSGISPYGQQTRIIPATRTLPIWERVEIAWSTAEETLKLLLTLAEQLYRSAGDIQGALPEELYDSLDNLGNQHRRLQEVQDNLNGFVSDPDALMIYWAEVSPSGNQLSLQVAPLTIGPLMEKYLWHEKSSVILTSATLTTNFGFDYIRNRLNADEAGELLLGSPFDYESSALLYLLNDIPEPNDRHNYQRAVDNILVKLARATGGRMLVLYTSYAQLKRTAQVITPALEDMGIYVYEQGRGASPNALLENFRTADKAVLLGTRAFWEGVDIPGEALSVLVIVKLPFDVPSDPIVAARSETFEDPFYEFQLPEAVLRFRQGFGRLIRTQFDRGVIAVMDKRILTKRYGKTFLDSLPQCTVMVDSMHKLAKSTTQWLNL
jgi:ATP-dependent DNA helicase DinG